MKILVIGHKQHGKGTLANIAENNFGLRCMGTSQYNAERMFHLLKDEYGYRSVEECYLDRNNHREFWFNKINEYCEGNLSRVIDEIFIDHDLCEGVRNRLEFDCAKEKKSFDLVVWVDASDRMPLESGKSMELNENDADVILKNNDTETDFLRVCVNFLKSTLNK